MQILEIRAITVASYALFYPSRRRQLDFDAVGAPVGELTDTGRPSADTGQIEYLETAERQRGVGHRAAFLEWAQTAE